MYRATAWRLRILKGGHGDKKAVARFASSNAVAASCGMPGWFRGGGSNFPPLNYPLEGIQLPSSLPAAHVDCRGTEITTLPNGVRIASESSSSNPAAASIGLYVNSGSIYETPTSFGATHLLERMAFKSTTYNRSHLRVVREVEAIGGNVTASASREQMGYSCEALKTYVPQMVELLVDCVTNQAFLDWELKQQIQKMKFETSEYALESLLLEAIHSAGYTGALANPLVASEGSLNRLEDSSILEEFVAANYTAPRIVLAASGVEHDQLLKYAEPLLSDLPGGGGHVEEPKSVYVGGDHRIMAADQKRTSFAIAFELPGGWLNVKDAMTLTVLEMLMGGGTPFSAGGPGKGTQSRLYLRVLTQYSENIHSISAFSSIYNSTAIFGIQATSSPEFAPRAIHLATKELTTLTHHVSAVRPEHLDRAKRSAKFAILSSMESRMVSTEEIGKQILTYGERKPVEFFLKAIDEVSGEDIESIIRRLISSPLTMASYGDVANLPTYDSVSSKFLPGNWYRYV